MARPSSVPPPGGSSPYGGSSPGGGSGAPASGPSGGPPDTGFGRNALFGLCAVAVVIAGALLYLLRGGDSPLSPLAEAAQRSAAQGARVAGEAEVAGPNGRMSMSFTGAMSADGRQAEMRMKVDSSSAPAAAARIGEMRQIVDGTTIYINAPAFAADLGGRAWMKMDLGEFFTAEQMQAGPTDAASMLRQLEAAGSTRLVGSERLSGKRTKHYRATIEPTAQAESLREAGLDEAAELVEQQGSPTTIDVWIDRAGLVRRMAMTGAAAGPGTEMRTTMDFFDYGSDPLIAVPPDDQVDDATELGEQLLEGMSG